MEPDEIETMTVEQAETAQVHSAQIYARNALWSRLPAELQGDLSGAARSLRAERVEAAAQTWLAASARMHALEYPSG